MDKFIEHFNNLVLPEGKERREITLNEKMLSLVIPAEYEGGDVAEKIHNPR